MKQRFNITDEISLTQCMTEIVRRHQDGQACHVIISDKCETRSQAQNRLYWQWVHAIAYRLGYGDDEMHTQLKRKYLAPIYARDDGQMADMFNAVKACKTRMGTHQYERIALSVATLLTTTKADTRQFSEYLNNIERMAYAQGIYLPVPDDLRWAIKNDRGKYGK